MLYTIPYDKRQFLKDKIIKGARLYKKHLMDKDFLIVCEDGSSSVVKFFKADFLHLTGVKTNLTEDGFFDNSVGDTLDVANISEQQKYNWNTLKSKAIRIEKIHKILYENVKNTLFMINLKTNTKVFPVAIKNSNADTCIGFVGNINKARTLRKYSSSNNADAQKRILAIFEKKQTAQKYNKLVYITSVKELYDKKADIDDYITVHMKDRLSYIV